VPGSDCTSILTFLQRIFCAFAAGGNMVKQSAKADKVILMFMLKK
jgi:hypothetical protein